MVHACHPEQPLLHDLVLVLGGKAEPRTEVRLYGEDTLMQLMDRDSKALRFNRRTQLL
jgi:hypothetical protein